MRAVGWLVMALGLLRYPSAVQVRWIAMPCLWQPRRLAWAVRCMCRVSSWIQRCWNRCDLDGGGFSAPTQKKPPKRWSREISVWKNGGSCSCMNEGIIVLSIWSASFQGTYISFGSVTPAEKRTAAIWNRWFCLVSQQNLSESALQTRFRFHVTLPGYTYFNLKDAHKF